MKIKSSSNSAILNIVKEVLKGGLKLPFFQRDYVWDHETVKKFAISFLNNEYLNSLIVAEFSKDIRVRDLPFVEELDKIYGINRDDNAGFSLVIDGQQRLSTLIFLLFNDLLFADRNYKLVFEKFLSEKMKKGEDDLTKILSDLRSKMKAVINQYLWVVVFSKDDKNYIASEVLRYSTSEIKKLLKPLDDPAGMSYEEFVFELTIKIYEELVREDELEDNEVALPIFTLRSLTDIHEVISNSELKLSNLKNLVKEAFKDPSKSDETLEKMFDFFTDFNISTESDSTYVILSDIKDSSELAETFEKLNTVLVRLNYSDILRAVLAKYRFNDEPFDLKTHIDKLMEERDDKNYKKAVLEKLKNITKDFHEYAVRGFNLMSELKKEGEVTLGVKRKHRDVNLGLAESVIRLYDSSEEFLENLRNYLKFLVDFSKYFDKYSNLISFGTSLDGAVIVYAAAGLLAAHSEVNQKNIERFAEKIAKSYLAMKLVFGEFFRHPDNIFQRIKRDDLDEIIFGSNWKFMLEKYIVHRDGVEEHLNQFVNTLDFRDAENPLRDPNNFDVLLVIQSLYRRGENLLTLDCKIISNLLENGNIDFKNVEKHHLFPLKGRRKGEKMKERDNLMNLVLLSEETNKSISDKEPRDYWENLLKNERFRECLAANLVPNSDNKFFKNPPENEEEFWEERMNFVKDALKEILEL